LAITTERELGQYALEEDEPFLVAPFPTNVLIKCQAEILEIITPGLHLPLSVNGQIDCERLVVINPKTQEWKQQLPLMKKLEQLQI